MTYTSFCFVSKTLRNKHIQDLFHKNTWHWNVWVACKSQCIECLA